MFPKSDNITVSPPIKICNSNVNWFFNTSNLSCVHKQALAIQPEWLNGFNVSFKKLIAIDNTVDASEAATNLVHFVKHYPLNNGSNALRESHCIRLTLNPHEKSSKLSVCFHPSSACQIQFKNHIFAPRIFNQLIQSEKHQSSSSINTRNECEFDWFGKTSRVSLSVFASNVESISSNFSFLKEISSNFAIETGIYCNQTKHEHFLIEPWLATAISNRNINLAGSIWLNSLKVDLSCFKRINDRIKIGSLFCVNTRARNMVGEAFCQFNFGDSIICAKSTSNGLIGATHEFKIWNFNIINSILTNYNTKKMIYGIQVEMDM